MGGICFRAVIKNSQGAKRRQKIDQVKAAALVTISEIEDVAKVSKGDDKLLDRSARF